jgi:hypothetical protein
MIEHSVEMIPYGPLKYDHSVCSDRISMMNAYCLLSKSGIMKPKGTQREKQVGRGPRWCCLPDVAMKGRNRINGTAFGARAHFSTAAQSSRALSPRVHLVYFTFLVSCHRVHVRFAESKRPVVRVWRPNDTEIETMGMRATSGTRTTSIEVGLEGENCSSLPGLPANGSLSV